ncbi:golgi uridine diphosphate-N- acetylglucosamine transporter [Geranomyces michiganensis]|nr:golgi uridine diphosphate-N- acetylglucosamine transporter [Geranomyces michiganensis]
MAKVAANRNSVTAPVAMQVYFREWMVIGALIFGGCCSNVYTLELLVSNRPKSGHLITFVQFLVVAATGLPEHLEWTGGLMFPLRLKRRTIPLPYWLAMVMLFWVVSVLNNFAFAAKISMPLHIIFRSGSLFVSMAIGWLFFGKKFSKAQVAGVSLVTLGVIAATYSSSSAASDTTVDANAKQSASNSILSSQWLFGLGLLFLALVLSCFLGQLQQITYAKFGPAWREGLFYTHLLGLPAFLLFRNDLTEQMRDYNASPPVALGDALEPAGEWFPGSGELLKPTPWSGIEIPSMWLYLIFNVATQYICISGVHRLSSMSSAVTLNLILSVRKFVSLVISVWLFGSEFTVGQWIGSAAVFAGTAIYTHASQRAKTKTA